MIKKGIYRHFKGNKYKVIGTAIHSETMEEMVIYIPLYGEGKTWVRPLENFLSKKLLEGKEVERFTFVSELEKQNKVQ